VTTAPQPASEPDRAGPRAPAPLLVAVALVGVEALLLVLVGIAELFSLTSERATMGVTTSLFFIGYGAVLGLFAWLLRGLRSWTRAPVVLAQLIQLGMAWSFRGGGTTLAAVALALVALVVLAGIFHPDSLRAVEDADGAENPQAGDGS
jgi:hypothetical protein